MNYIDYYEKDFYNYNDAKKCADIVGGTISTFISINEAGEYITVYAVKYKVLF